MSDVAFRTRVRRTAWVPAVIGGLGGVIAGVVGAAASGSLNNAVLLAMFDGAAGIVLGVVTMAIALLAVTVVRSPRWATVTGALVATAVAAVVALWLTRGNLLIAMTITAALAAVGHFGAAALIRTSPHEESTNSEPATTPTPRGVRVLFLVGGGAAALVLSPSAVGLLRETLHVGCTYGTEGEALGAWMCADGIGYIFPGLTLLLGPALSLLIGLLIVLAGSSAERGRLTINVFAAAPVLWAVGWLASVTLPRTDALPAGASWVLTWWAAVGIAALIALVGVLLVAVANVRASHTLRLIGFALLLAGTILQPALGLATSAAAALLVVAMPLSGRGNLATTYNAFMRSGEQAR